MSKHRYLGSFVLGVLAAAFAGCSGAPVEEETGSESAAIAVQTKTVELIASEDARTQAASGDVNFGGGIILWTNVPGGHQSFVKFDVRELPADAVIESARLELYFNGNYAGQNTTELGRVEGSWEESTITWNNQPTVTWGGPTAPVGDAAGDLTFDVTSLVTDWHDGAHENDGFALRSSVVGGKQYWSREHGVTPPRLVVTYSRPPEPAGPRPDLGDAADRTNHHGINNTAYPFTGVLGRFPTVFNLPAGQIAGPRHDNATVQGFLGEFMSRETDADVGPDQDVPNNILRNSVTGALGDVCDNDYGDDGWRNTGIRFFDCQRQELVVRVSRAAGATLPTMFLNVWFDGNRDGDWEDTGPCVPPTGGAAQPSFEWIVQNRPVNLAAIPAGGFADVRVDTARVRNLTEGLPHWMRFTLSEAPAVQPPAGLPDGRGPHPTVSPIGFRYGETEDRLQLPPPPISPFDLEVPGAE